MPSKIGKRKLFQNLKDVNVFAEDTDNSIFNIRNVPEIFALGKSYFLILGSNKLKHKSDIEVEIIDSNGNPVYYDIPIYLESTGRAVSVWIYHNAQPGKATVTILGELENVPSQWKDRINVKKTFTITIDPSETNTQSVRFVAMPDVSASIFDRKFLEYSGLQWQS